MSVKLYNLRKASMLKGMSLAVLVWSQLAFAFHQSEHDIVDYDELCAICVKFDRDHEALVGVQTASLLPAATGSDIIAAPAFLPASTSPFFRARASPHFLIIR